MDIFITDALQRDSELKMGNEQKITRSLRLQCIVLFTRKYIFIFKCKLTLDHDFVTDDLYVDVPPLILRLKNTDFYTCTMRSQ